MWNELGEFREHEVDTGLRVGDFLHASTYVWFHALIRAEQGNFSEALELAEKCATFSDQYGYDAAWIYSLLLRTDVLIRRRDYSEALVRAEEGVEFSSAKGMDLHRLMFLGFRVVAHALSRDIDRAYDSIGQAEEIVASHGFIFPFYAAPLMAGRLLTDILMVENKITNHKVSGLRDYNIVDRGNVRRASRNARRYAPYRTWI